MSGDVRRSLEACRQALDEAQHMGSFVCVQEMDVALQRMFSDLLFGAIRRCTLHQQIILLAAIFTGEQSGSLTIGEFCVWLIEDGG
jgi:hypothetical protein